uniref:Uncharacterized protein n=1 Tax=Arundo donax TaxID=35708 RepID=A0A0A9JL07_ARUDO
MLQMYQIHLWTLQLIWRVLHMLKVIQLVQAAVK